jgi:flagellar basal-body rod modification protein FlgD
MVICVNNGLFKDRIMAIEGINSATSTQLAADYMTMLLTQLKNQDPLEPMDNSQMTAQLTSLSQLEQMEKMNTYFSSVLSNVEFSYAQSLVGKVISFYDYTNDKTINAKVSEAILSSSEGTKLVAGDYLVGINEVMSISEQLTDNNS